MPTNEPQQQQGTAQPITAQHVVAWGESLLAQLQAALPEQSVTARTASRAATDALKQFERQALLLSYEHRRQQEVAQRRAEHAAAARAEAERLAAEREHTRHVAALTIEANRQNALKQAQEYVSKQKAGK